MDNNKIANKIRIGYTDGSHRDVKKGLVFYFQKSDDAKAHITAELLDMDVADFTKVVGACIQMGKQFGIDL